MPGTWHVENDNLNSSVTGFASDWEQLIRKMAGKRSGPADLVASSDLNNFSTDASFTSIEEISELVTFRPNGCWVCEELELLWRGEMDRIILTQSAANAAVRCRSRNYICIRPPQSSYNDTDKWTKGEAFGVIGSGVP
ncbi:hypothetical protein ACJJTC_008248 [Scirpophaga incertulas]